MANRSRLGAALQCCWRVRIAAAASALLACSCWPSPAGGCPAVALTTGATETSSGHGRCRIIRLADSAECHRDQRNTPTRRIAVPLPKAICYSITDRRRWGSSASGDRRNVMAAYSWAMPLDFDSPKVAVVVDKSTLTREPIEAKVAEFVAPVSRRRPMAERVLAAGSTASGRAGDKFARFGIAHGEGRRSGRALAAADRRLRRLWSAVDPRGRANQQTYDLFLAGGRCPGGSLGRSRDGRWHFADDAQVNDPCYRAGGHFFVTGEASSGLTGNIGEVTWRKAEGERTGYNQIV